MTWKPSEGLRRAESVANEIEEAAIACGLRADGDGVWSTLRWRVVEIVAKAIDKGIIDGAPAPVEGNGQAKWWEEAEPTILVPQSAYGTPMSAEPKEKAPKRKRKAKGRQRKAAAEPATTDTAAEA